MCVCGEGGGLKPALKHLLHSDLLVVFSSLSLSPSFAASTPEKQQSAALEHRHAGAWRDVTSIIAASTHIHKHGPLKTCHQLPLIR